MVKVARKIKEVAGAVDNISKFKKLNKRQASYIEYDKFASSNLREGYLQLYLLDKYRGRQMYDRRRRRSRYNGECI